MITSDPLPIQKVWVRENPTVINSDGVELIKRFEGLKLHSYQDEGGIWTIGYGNTQSVSPGMTITEKQALDFLNDKLRIIEKSVSSCIRVPVNSNEYSALICFTYNLGTQALEGSSLMKFLNSGQRQKTADEFLRWDHVGGREVEGLARRRAAERCLFLKPIRSR